MSRKIFVTGTDTGSGKSYVASRLIRQLQAKGISSIALKPVACGCKEGAINEDVAVLLEAQGLADPAEVNLYSFSGAASPNIAAAAENRSIDCKTLVRWCEERASGFDICLIEGVGGLMVPLHDRYLVREWMSDLMPCEEMLVIGAKLGAINHALLTLEQLKQAGMFPSYVVINAIDEAYLSDVERSVAPFLPKECKVVKISFDAEEHSFALLADLLVAN